MIRNKHGTLLRELAERGAVAPGPFSLSVHNAVSALESIAHGDTGNYTAVAAAGESAELAIVEALALLADGHAEVIVTVYDETVPDCYRPYVDDADAAFAWSWRVRQAGAEPGFELGWAAGKGARESASVAEAAGAGPVSCRADQPSQAHPVPVAPCPVPHDDLPPALRVLAYFLSDAETLSHDGSHCCWTWRRTAPHHDQLLLGGEQFPARRGRIQHYRSQPQHPTIDGLKRGGVVEISYRVKIRDSINKALADHNYVVTNSVQMTADDGASKAKINDTQLTVNVTDGEVLFYDTGFTSVQNTFKPGTPSGCR